MLIEKTSLIQEWERAKLGAQDFIDAMPEDKIGFRPAPEIFSFAGQFLHIANTNHRFAGALSNASEPPAALTEPVTKAALKEFALASYDAIIKALQSLGPEALGEEITFHKWTMPRRIVASKALEHHAHHRGQTVIYFRVQGLQPPSERLF